MNKQSLFVLQIYIFFKCELSKSKFSNKAELAKGFILQHPIFPYDIVGENSGDFTNLGLYWGHSLFLHIFYYIIYRGSGIICSKYNVVHLISEFHDKKHIIWMWIYFINLLINVLLKVRLCFDSRTWIRKSTLIFFIISVIIKERSLWAFCTLRNKHAYERKKYMTVIVFTFLIFQSLFCQILEGNSRFCKNVLIKMGKKYCVLIRKSNRFFAWF